MHATQNGPGYNNEITITRVITPQSVQLAPTIFATHGKAHSNAINYTYP